MSQKYTMFRNFMVNELAVTREDIEEWTKQAIAAEVNKVMGQINLSEIARTEIHRIAESMGGYKGLTELVSREITNRFKISVEIKP